MATRKIIVGRCLILILFYISNTVRSESNVALSKATEQSSEFGGGKHVASNVVDGCLTDFDGGCCTHTEAGQNTAWWRVDLGELKTIDRITIYYRNGFQHRLAGYQLYVSNTTNTPTDGVLCYEDTSSTRDAVQLVVTHQCPYVGRYVTVYNHRNPKRYNWYSDYAILELCEVQVFGCQVGKYGDRNCNSPCSPACYGGNCNSKYGFCFYCFTGKYGVFCNSDCPSNCKNSLCTKDAGNCLECITGKYGNTCDEVCPANCKDMLCGMSTGHCIECIPGKYGNTCGQDCPVNCKDMLCEKSTGNCIDCVPQKYGVKCEGDCSANCQDRLCDQVNGNCYECIPGKKGDNCDQNCPGNCKNMLCERDTGSCKECIPGKKGYNCDQNCSGNCKDMMCERYTGSCKECVTGTYGNTCDQDCPRNCNDSLCIRDSGHCIDCVSQKHGTKCELNCSTNCLDSLCEKDSGNCYDCIPGKYGPNCDQDCSGNCKDMLCDKETGSCKGGLLFDIDIMHKAIKPIIRSAKNLVNFDRLQVHDDYGFSDWWHPCLFVFQYSGNTVFVHCINIFITILVTITLYIPCI
ncbi:cell death abnormality protein 1-like [Pecten maximus]|uniref:cell death abnormality protein 1-like n=1 Tax=Pecten maximus TaxID=6579 RepID=UPI0014586005|nr:cell death abnormality protein 1-like [Pecten maximus]